jgi:hypothetical protein
VVTLFGSGSSCNWQNDDGDSLHPVECDSRTAGLVPGPRASRVCEHRRPAILCCVGVKGGEQSPRRGGENMPVLRSHLRPTLLSRGDELEAERKRSALLPQQHAQHNSRATRREMNEPRMRRQYTGLTGGQSCAPTPGSHLCRGRCSRAAKTV